MENNGLDSIWAMQLRLDDCVVDQRLLVPGTYSLGANTDQAICLNYPNISRNHGQIIIENSGLVFYRDLNSTNGATVVAASGKKLRSVKNGTQCHLNTHATGDSIELLCLGPYAISIRQCRRINPAAAARQLSEDLAQAHKTLKNEALTKATLLVHAYGLAADLPLPRTRIEQICDELLSEWTQNGPIEDWLNSKACREILINGPQNIFIDEGYGLYPLNRGFHSKESLVAWARRLASAIDVRLDPSHPIAEGTLPDGARFQAVMEPIAAQGVNVAIRRFPVSCPDESSALQSGWITKECLAMIHDLIVHKKNILVAGGTAAGKTTLLNFIARYISHEERIVSVEDIFELQLNHSNWARMRCRGPNTEGSGIIQPRQLIRTALRLRPDRIIVGECRGGEAFDMLQAMNTGHPGSMATVHANSATSALLRVSTLAQMADENISEDLATRLTYEALDAVIFVEKVEEKGRSKRLVREALIKNNGTNQFERAFSI
jgi:pilus assembly protein CpaF